MNMALNTTSNITIDKNHNALTLTLKCATVQSLIIFLDNIKLSKLNTQNLNLNQINTPSYLPYILSSGIVECVNVILPDLTQRKRIQYTKTLSLGIGIITSTIVSSGFNGIEYFISFSISLLKSSASTLIIDKLNKLKTIDGISVAIILNCLISIPTMIMGVATSGLVMTLLFITSMGLLFLGNYKLLKSTEDIDIHYRNKTDTFSLSCRNTCTTSLMISSMIMSLISHGSAMISNGLMLVICPLVQWFMSRSVIDTEELNKHIQQNGIYLNGLKHGKETTNMAKRMIMKNSLKLGCVGALVFILSSLIIKIFAVSISAITLATFVNSLMTVSFGVKSIVKRNRLVFL
jgi:preprotein translocase subunit SecY